MIVVITKQAENKRHILCDFLTRGSLRVSSLRRLRGKQASPRLIRPLDTAPSVLEPYSYTDSNALL